MTTESTTQPESTTPPAKGKSAFLARWQTKTDAPPAEQPKEAPAEAPPAAEQPEVDEVEVARKKALADADAKLRARQEEAARRRRVEQDEAAERQRREIAARTPEPAPVVFDEADPVGSIRRMGKDPKAIYEKLTREAHSPGISKIEEDIAATRRMAEDANKRAAAANEELERRDREAQIKERRQSIVARLGTDAYPLSAKLDPAKRERLAIDEWQRFAEAEINAGRAPEYDEELIALRVEDTLDELTKPIRGKTTTKPKASAPKPPISTSAAAEPSVKHTPRSEREFRAAFLRKHGAV